jgi:hypothetical protein
MRYSWIAVVIAFVLAAGCTPQIAAQQSNSPQPDIPQPISAALTCGEFLRLIHSKVSGSAIIWLDGYYSGRAGLPELPADWIHTVSQGLGGTCSITVNASRSVLDVIAQLHREYGGVAR